MHIQRIGIVGMALDKRQPTDSKSAEVVGFNCD